MRKNILALALACAAGAASAGNLDIYAGTRLGMQHSDAAVTGALSAEHKGATSELFVGRQVSPSLAVEVSASDYAKLGLVDSTGRNTSNWGRSLALEGVYKHNLQGPWALTARGGLAYTKGSFARDKQDRLAPVLGLGVQYLLSPTTFLDLQWRHLHGMGVASNQVDTVTAGVGFRF